MGDIIFKCPECESDLSVTDKGAGASVACPECGKAISIPWPDICFSCSSCNQSLFTTFDLVNEPIACPKCNQSVIVPHLSAEAQILQTHSNDCQEQIQKCQFCLAQVPHLATKCKYCGESLVPQYRGLRRFPFLLISSLLVIFSLIIAYKTIQLTNKATKKTEDRTDETYAIETDTEHLIPNTQQSSHATDSPLETIGDQEWTRFANSDKAIYLQDTNDISSLVIAQYWSADYLDRVQYVCFANELRKTDAFRAHYRTWLAKGQDNSWNTPDQLVKISQSVQITWLDYIDSSVWRIVEVEYGTVTNTRSACYIINASMDPPKILWSPNMVSIKDRSEVHKIFEVTKSPYFSELLYLHYYSKWKEEFPDLSILDYQISAHTIKSFPEKLRNSHGILWGNFSSIHDNTDNLPGVTTYSDGLISRVRVGEKEKYLGVSLMLRARTGTKIDWFFFRNCFTRKTPLSFDKWSLLEQNAPLIMLGQFFTLDRSGGSVGFYATQVMTYNLGQDKWICLTE